MRNILNESHFLSSYIWNLIKNESAETPFFSVFQRLVICSNLVTPTGESAESADFLFASKVQIRCKPQKRDLCGQQVNHIIQRKEKDNKK